MNTRANRSSIREQIRRARSTEHMNTRWQQARTPRARAKAAIDYLSAYLAHAQPADQRHIADRLEKLARDTRTARPGSHSWLVKRLSRLKSPRRRADATLDCIRSYLAHTTPQGADRMAGRLKAVADSTRTAR